MRFTVTLCVMDLDTYLTKKGRGEHARLAKATDSGWATIQDIRKKGAVPRLALALAIERETGGKVKIADLCGGAKRAPKRRSA